MYRQLGCDTISLHGSAVKQAVEKRAATAQGLDGE
jgi:hypothetical protein